MTTAFAAIVSAFKAELEAAPAVSTYITRARDRDVPAEAADAINVQYEGADPFPGAMHGAPVDWQVQVTVECFARSSTTSGDLAVDPILEAAYERLAANPTLSGLVGDIGTPTIRAESDAQGQKTGWIGMTYTVRQRTNNLTLD